MKKTPWSRWFWLFVWLAAILFPLAAMRDVSFWWMSTIDLLFAGELRHIVFHIFLFGGLVLLLFALFELPWCRRGWLIAGLAVLAVGALQEIIQALTGASAATWSGALFDLVIDLGGGVIGVGIWGLVRRFKKP